MIVKSFAADTVAGALKRVRTELGGEAVILKTRKVPPEKRALAGGKVEVTACLDKPGGADTATVVPAAQSIQGPPPSSPKAHSGDIPAEAIAQKLDFLLDVVQMPVRKTAYSGNIGRAFTAMLSADIPENMARDIADKLSDRLSEETDYETVCAAAEEFLFNRFPKVRDAYVFKTGQKIVLVGPAGSGKTSMMGRLAGYLIGQRRLPISLTSLDKVKVSAPEELQTYADILDVDRFEMPSEIDRSLLERESKGKITFIDTPALNPKDKEHIALYAEKLARINAARVIGVFPAWCRTADVFDILRAYRPLGLTELAFTMLDQTTRLGGIIAMAIQYGLPVTILGNGHKAGNLNLLPDYREIIKTVFRMGENR